MRSTFFTPLPLCEMIAWPAVISSSPASRRHQTPLFLSCSPRLVDGEESHQVVVLGDQVEAEAMVCVMPPWCRHTPGPVIYCPCWVTWREWQRARSPEMGRRACGRDVCSLVALSVFRNSWVAAKCFNFLFNLIGVQIVFVLAKFSGQKQNLSVMLWKCDSLVVVQDTLVK